MLVKLAIPLMLLASGAVAQELFGVVRDQAGLPLPGADVIATGTATGTTAKTVSDPDGSFHFFALAPGEYTLSAEKPGFALVRRTGMRLRVADRVEIDIELPVSGVYQSVEVAAAAPLLQTATGTVSFAAGDRRTSALPLDGRNFLPLVALAPGVALPAGSFLPRINGSRPRTNEYLYDGVSVLQPEPGQPAYYPVLDGIDEFRVEVNSYSAEYGRSNGGVIQVNTKSGSNELHGTIFEFVRNDALNARNLFALPGPKPPFKRNQFGAALGGPVQRNKTFFFGDWQSTRLRTGNTRISTVPTLAQREGVFAAPVYDPATNGRERFPNDTIPRSRLDPAAAQLMARYPVPNTPGAANNYRRLAIDSTDQDQFEGRADRYFGNRHRVFGRYVYLRDHSMPGTPLPDGSGALASGMTGDTRTSAGSAAFEDTWTISAASVNQFRFGYTQRGFTRSALPSLPIYQIAGYQQIGPPEAANARFHTSVAEWNEHYSTVRGSHSLKLGGDIRMERLDVYQPPDGNGLYGFNSLFTGNSMASFLLGQVASYNIDFQPQTLQPRAHIAEFFVQDDWRAGRRLSLGLGLRYTLNFPSTEAHDRSAVFNLGTQRLDFLGRDGVPRSARRLHYGNFGPRATLAYAVSDSFAIRSGYGLVWIEQAGITTPFTTPFFPFIQSVGQRSLNNIDPAFVLSQGPSVQPIAPVPDAGLGQGVFAVDRYTGSGYAQQWNFTLQKTVGQDWSLEAGYLGSKLTRLGVPDTNLNQLPASALALGPLLTAAVPNPYFGEIPAWSSIGGSMIARQQLQRPFPRFTTVSFYRNNIGNSTYHAFQAHLERRFSAGLTLTAAYTFSKLIDDASSVFDAAVLTGPVANFPVADSQNRHLEKDLSNGDIPHIFSAGFLYELPWRRLHGWQVAGIVRAQSGMPLAISQATNFNAFAGFGTQRPNRIGDPGLEAGQRTLARYFNTGAFAQAAQFTIGNSSRNPVRGPGYQDADLMVGKTFTLSEHAGLEFRAEVFNVSNTPPLGAPNTVLGSPAFGSITSALDPRVFEAALKLKF